MVADSKALLSDEIMERAYENFIEVGKIQGLFSIDDPVQPKIVVNSPVHVIDRTVSRFLVADEDG
jgi:hypothetical protein